MAKKIKTYLENQGFYNYLSNQHLPKLQKQIKRALSAKSKTNLSLPLSKASPAKDFLLLELGGTFLHISLVRKNKLIKDQILPFYQKNKVYTAKNLAKLLAEYANKYLQPNTQTLVIALANSLQTKLIKAELVSKILFFGKNHAHHNLIGHNLTPLIKKHLRQKMQVHLINDGLISTLGNFSRRPLLSLIVGTGVNLCLAMPKTKSLFLANLEMGDFKFLKPSSFDRELDLKSTTPGRFTTEKILAGAWHYQLFQIILSNLTASKLLNARPFIKKIGKWSSADIEKYFTTTQLSDQEKDYYWIWREMNKRGAYIHAQIITQLIKISSLNEQLDLQEIGSLIKHDDYYRRFLHIYLRRFSLEYGIKKPNTSLSATDSVQGAKNLLTIV